MKEQESVVEYRLHVTLWVYALALLLAMLIATVHVAFRFGLADVLEFLRGWTSSFGRRPADIVLIGTAISGLFAAHLVETACWALFFWKSGNLSSFGDGWYFAGVSHTTLGYG